MRHPLRELIVDFIAVAVIAVAMLLAVSCGPEKVKVEAPRIQPVTDNASADLRHRDEMNRAAEDHRRALDAEQVDQVHLMGRITFGVAALGAICLVAGFFLIKSGAGQALVVVGVLCLTFAWAATYYGQKMAVFMAIGFGIVSLGALAFLGVTMWRYLRTSKALEQTVAVNEEAKAIVLPENKQVIWGKGGIAAATYSPSTTRTVDAIRAKLSKQKGTNAPHHR